MALEIERKFLLNETPEQLIERGAIRKAKEQRIEQTYLAMDETQELRIRRITDLRSGQTEYTHTFKLGNGMTREEIEYSISGSIYEQVAGAFGAVPLTKNRITAEWQDKVLEIDVYDQLELTVVEVEFESEDEANSFAPPEWFGRDIGSEKQYSNKTVWKQLQNK
ncbi:CYTH domain-containing protein [Cohnella fermenti]|uniref:CYTH domain-containing protein n=1 Tax=Cohnella fermenti TaxID=2565925 RepID=A0A4S4BIB6_9BACL|nr:CYTH domain-containing protein [Cohnella fermenti]THF73721.1 CYTH domain-containing protein [Cohnella fermenti]